MTIGQYFSADRSVPVFFLVLPGLQKITVYHILSFSASLILLLCVGVACAIPSVKTAKRRKETTNRSIKTAYRRFIVSLIFFSLQMLQDYRYDRTREALLKGELKTFREIVETLPKTRIAEVISSNNDRVTWCIDHPWHFTAQELIVLSDALGIEISILVDMAVTQYRAGGNEKNKRRIRNGRKNNNNNTH